MTSTYPSTLGDLTRRVRRRLLTKEDGTAQDHWSADAIKDALNWYQRELYNEILLQFETLYFTKTDDFLEPVNNRIDLPLDHKRTVTFEKNIGAGEDFVEVRLVSPTRYQEFMPSLYPRVEGELGAITEVWSEFPGYLKAMGSFVVEGRYRLIYQHQIEDLQSDSIETTVPNDYQDILVDGAAYRLASDAGQDDRASRLLGDYERGMERMRRTAGQLNLVKQHRIKNVYLQGGRW